MEVGVSKAAAIFEGSVLSQMLSVPSISDNIMVLLGLLCYSLTTFLNPLWNCMSMLKIVVWIAAKFENSEHTLSLS